METNLCKCGCNTIIHKDKNYVRGHNPPWNKGLAKEELLKHYTKGYDFLKQRKGKTYEEIYGTLKAKRLKEKLAVVRKNISPETRLKLSQNNPRYWLGKKLTFQVWHKGLTKAQDKRLIKTEETNKHHSQMLKGKMPKNLEFINRNKIGEGNPSWKGGISYRGYDKNWTRRFKILIRKRDNYVCLNCLKHQEQEKESLSVHHINYDKKMSIEENCISLCCSCHHKTDRNKKYWMPFFQSLLSDKYGYQYSQNHEPIINIQAENCEKDTIGCQQMLNNLNKNGSEKN